MSICIKRAAVLLVSAWIAARGATEETGKVNPVTRESSGSQVGGSANLLAVREVPCEEEVALWMDRLRLQDAEEFARLKRLREEAPEAFRAEVRRKFWKRWVEGREKRSSGTPEAHGAGDREWMDLEREVRDWVRRHREASDPEARARIRETLRARILEVMKRREAIWRSRLEAIRRELDQIEQRLRRWEALREEWIERRLNRLLADEPASSARPPSADTP